MSTVVVAIAGHYTIELDPVDDKMYVFVFGVRVTRNDVLVAVQSHTIQVALTDVGPLGVC